MKTAIEHLEQELERLGVHLFDEAKEAIEQAKEMEKEQMMDAWNNGIQWEWDSSIRNSEEYYNKTFKSE